ncbi:MAG TPA: DUF2180 family protein [Thermoleophilaceae bacterium]|jgi:hypothetical protein
MNCFVCAGEGKEVSAVALCQGCAVALCRDHLAEELRSPGPGGLKYDCNHIRVKEKSR